MRVQTSVAPEAELERAPFALRCGALLIDYMLVVGVFAMMTIIARVFEGEPRGASMSSTTATLGYALAALIVFLNFIVMAGWRGRTLGKWATGLQIRRTNGEPINILHATVRHIIGYPLSLLFFGAGFLIAALNSRGRALHDYLASTVVVRGAKTQRPRRQQAKRDGQVVARRSS